MSESSEPATGYGAENAFGPEQLDRMVITPPLLYALREPGSDDSIFEVIIDLNLDYPEGREAARESVLASIARGGGEAPGGRARSGGTDPTQPYLFASLSGATIRFVVANDRQGTTSRGAIYRVWEDAIVYPLITKSIATVKADAAQIAYGAVGAGIVWAVMDSGIEGGHIHFEEFANLHPPKPVAHIDFSKSASGALSDPFGHGTHVAGIIAGQFKCRDGDSARKVLSTMRDENGDTISQISDVRTISGMAPRCKLVSYKVLDDAGRGRVSAIIDAIAAVQRLNDYGRRLLVHGVNLSVGYDFDPKWFACGQSPLCVEIDRLVRSGVVVVAAAGNTGYGWTQTLQRGNVASGLTMSINDPGNSELAITVGSTHRDMPHTYGVSYFSSKGPTGDGRAKPDLVAPGERIISCAAGTKRNSDAAADPVDYVEDSGTSMAAPHVAGIVAGFLSIRREYIGLPSELKAILLATATDLKRERSFQGAGLVDFMRAIASV